MDSFAIVNLPLISARVELMSERAHPMTVKLSSASTAASGSPVL